MDWPSKETTKPSRTLLTFVLCLSFLLVNNSAPPTGSYKAVAGEWVLTGGRVSTPRANSGRGSPQKPSSPALPQVPSGTPGQVSNFFFAQPEAPEAVKGTQVLAASARSPGNSRKRFGEGRLYAFGDRMATFRILLGAPWQGQPFSFRETSPSSPPHGLTSQSPSAELLYQ